MPQLYKKTIIEKLLSLINPETAKNLTQKLYWIKNFAQMLDSLK